MLNLRLDQIIFVLWSVASCTSLGLNSLNTKPRTFDPGFSKENLQSWDDWMSKRSLGSYPWKIGELTGDKFQNWQDWMYKRRFGDSAFDSDFSSFDKSKFQEWKDWMSKRNHGPGAPFLEFSDLDKGKFQQWNEWVSKRMLDSKSSNFEPSFGSGTGFQNWADFAKRQNFISPSADLGISSSPHFQNWQDWAKRAGADKIVGVNLSDRNQKRQLGLNGDRYDSFRRYFTDGLQDWRSTYKSTKRDKKNMKTEKK